MLGSLLSSLLSSLLHTQTDTDPRSAHLGPLLEPKKTRPAVDRVKPLLDLKSYTDFVPMI